MAQILKDEIRERILASALEEFYCSGYKSATMRGIAAKAKNTYRADLLLL